MSREGLDWAAERQALYNNAPGDPGRKLFMARQALDALIAAHPSLLTDELEGTKEALVAGMDEIVKLRYEIGDIAAQKQHLQNANSAQVRVLRMRKEQVGRLARELDEVKSGDFSSALHDQRRKYQARIDQLEDELAAAYAGDQSAEGKMWVVFVQRADERWLSIIITAKTAAQAMTEAMRSVAGAVGALVLPPAVHSLFLNEEVRGQ